jgi:hypothetical protein
VPVRSLFSQFDENDMLSCPCSSPAATFCTRLNYWLCVFCNGWQHAGFEPKGICIWPSEGGKKWMNTSTGHRYPNGPYPNSMPIDGWATAALLCNGSGNTTGASVGGSVVSEDGSQTAVALAGPPPTAACLAAETKLCGSARSSLSACEACGLSHITELVTAGCTDINVAAFCNPGGPPTQRKYECKPSKGCNVCAVRFSHSQ